MFSKLLRDKICDYYGYLLLDPIYGEKRKNLLLMRFYKWGREYLRSRSSNWESEEYQEKLIKYLNFRHSKNYFRVTECYSGLEIYQEEPFSKEILNDLTYIFEKEEYFQDVRTYFEGGSHRLVIFFCQGRFTKDIKPPDCVQQ